MARRELDALLGHEVEKRVMRRRGGAMHRLDDALIGLRAGDRQDLRKALGDRLRLGAHAAGDDDLAVLLQRRADRLQQLGLGAVEKAAGVDDDHIGAGMGARELVAFGAQPRDDALAVDERLGTAERDEGDARGGAERSVWILHGAHCHGGPPLQSQARAYAVSAPRRAKSATAAKMMASIMNATPTSPRPGLAARSLRKD